MKINKIVQFNRRILHRIEFQHRYNSAFFKLQGFTAALYSPLMVFWVLLFGQFSSIVPVRQFSSSEEALKWFKISYNRYSIYKKLTVILWKHEKKLLGYKMRILPHQYPHLQNSSINFFWVRNTDWTSIMKVLIQGSSDSNDFRKQGFANSKKNFSHTVSTIS